MKKAHLTSLVRGVHLDFIYIVRDQLFSSARHDE